MNYKWDRERGEKKEKEKRDENNFFGGGDIF